MRSGRPAWAFLSTLFLYAAWVCAPAVADGASPLDGLSVSTTATAATTSPTATPTPRPTRPADFGKRWVRSHPFHISALNQGATHLDIEEYQAAGGEGWLLHDEPEFSEFPFVAEAIAYCKQTYPEMLAYTNSSDFENYYLSEMVNVVQPDLLMYDQYPFSVDGSTSRSWTEWMMGHRNYGLANDLPYWAFIQAFSDDSRRLPSESDLRAHVYAHLAAGFTGISYFGYQFLDHGDSFDGMFTPLGERTDLYDFVATLNPEVRRLGNSLRFLTSTDIRTIFNLVTPDTKSNRINVWSSGAGDDPKLLQVGIAADAPVGSGKDGLIGFFEDDEDRRYFMIVNMWHGPDLSAADAELPYYVQFDDSVTELCRLNRLTAETETVALIDHRLEINLPGGTGALFKYPDGPFPAAGTPIPTPTTAATPTPTCEGLVSLKPYDLDGDGEINAKDLIALIRAIAESPPSSHDFNCDGFTESLDLFLFTRVWETDVLEKKPPAGDKPTGLPLN